MRDLMSWIGQIVCDALKKRFQFRAEIVEIGHVSHRLESIVKIEVHHRFAGTFRHVIRLPEKHLLGITNSQVQEMVQALLVPFWEQIQDALDHRRKTDPNWIKIPRQLTA